MGIFFPLSTLWLCIITLKKWGNWNHWDKVIYRVLHDSRLSDPRLFSFTWPYVVLPSAKYVEFVSILCIHAVVCYEIIWKSVNYIVTSSQQASGCHSLCATIKQLLMPEHNRITNVSFSYLNSNKNWSVVKSVYLLPFLLSTHKVA